jgi:hypothetical protein
MVLIDLELHPGSACEAVDAIAVEAEREGELLLLRYVVTGRIGGLRIPPLAPAERTEGLWRHTCFEAFVRARGEAGYVEMNLAPSTQWAAYRFDAYRRGVRDLDVPPPRIETGRTGRALELRAAMRPPVAPPWQVAFAVVIEEAGGRISWWAAHHPGATPDFHHPDSFVSEIQ